MTRLFAVSLLAFALLATPALAGPSTVGQFHRLPAKERRQVAIRFMTHHPVSPCGHRELTREEAQNIAPAIVQGVRPGRDPADGSIVKASTPLGVAIRHVLANIGC